MHVNTEHMECEGEERSLIEQAKRILLLKQLCRSEAQLVNWVEVSSKDFTKSQMMARLESDDY